MRVCVVVCVVALPLLASASSGAPGAPGIPMSHVDAGVDAAAFRPAPVGATTVTGDAAADGALPAAGSPAARTLLFWTTLDLSALAIVDGDEWRGLLDDGLRDAASGGVSETDAWLTIARF